MSQRSKGLQFDYDVTLLSLHTIRYGALAAPTHVRSCVEGVRVRSPEQTSSTLDAIPPG